MSTVHLYENLRLRSPIVMIVLYLLVFQHDNLLAQRGDCPEIKNQDAIKLYQEALGKPTYKLKEALNLLDRAVLLQTNFVDAYYKHAELCYSNANHMFQDTVFINSDDIYFKMAEKGFLKVIELCPSFNYYMANFKKTFPKRCFLDFGIFLAVFRFLPRRLYLFHWFHSKCDTRNCRSHLRDPIYSSFIFPLAARFFTFLRKDILRRSLSARRHSGYCCNQTN